MATLVRKPPCIYCQGFVYLDQTGVRSCLICGRSPVDPEAVVLDIPSPANAAKGGGARVQGQRIS